MRITIKIEMKPYYLSLKQYHKTKQEKQNRKSQKCKINYQLHKQKMCH